MCNFLLKFFQLNELLPNSFVTKKNCDKRLHVTNIFQRIIASFLFSPMGESMIGGSKVVSQMVVFHTITNKVLNTTMI
jgi:hypothetical protein